MAREHRPADPIRVGAKLTEAFGPPPSEIELRTAGLDARFPLDPDIDATAR